MSSLNGLRTGWCNNNETTTLKGTAPAAKGCIAMRLVQHQQNSDAKGHNPRCDSMMVTLRRSTATS